MKTRRNHINKDLTSCSHVFVRHDAIRKPLQPPYDDGPYKVISHGDKVFTVNVNGRQVTISIDRLKPAFLEKEPETVQVACPPVPTPVSSPRVTLLGRHVQTLH